MHFTDPNIISTSVEACRVSISESFDLLVNHFVEWDSASIFMTPAFFKLHQNAAASAHYFQLSRKSDQRVFGVAVFWELEPGIWVSPIRGSFGGFEFGAEMSLELTELFVTRVDFFLAGIGATQVRITAQPFAYDPAGSSILFNVLHRVGYRVAIQELNYSLALEGASFEEGLDTGNAKRLAKARRESLEVRKLEPEKLAEAYEVIRDNREDRGYPITMTFESLKEMISAFPDRIHLFGVIFQQRIIAASVCIEINRDVFYVFYWGHRKDVDQLSPVTFLASHIHRYASERLFKILDFGTATIEGEPNLGLIRYKRNLGSRESLKLSYWRSPSGS